MKNIIEKSFGLTIQIMNLFGLYPSETCPKLQKIWCYTLYLSMLVIANVVIIIKSFVKPSDLIETNSVLIYLVHRILSCFKLIPIIINSEGVKKCIFYFAHSRFEAEHVETKKIEAECVRVCRRNSTLYFVFLIIFLMFWCFPFLFIYQLSLDVSLSNDYLDNFLMFYLLYFYFSAATAYGIIPVPMLEPLIGGLAYQATSQLKILKYNLQHLEEFLDQTIDGKNDTFSLLHFERIKQHLEKCVNHHNEILMFVSEFEKCFSFSVFCQIAACTITLCFCLIGIIFSSRSFDTFVNLLSSVALIAQIYFYCYYGTLLLEENNNFIEAIYSSSWYNYDSRVKKMLFLMMERSKQPLVVTAGKILNLTLQTFVSFLKTSYSLIAVLKNYQ